MEQGIIYLANDTHSGKLAALKEALDLLHTPPLYSPLYTLGRIASSDFSQWITRLLEATLLGFIGFCLFYCHLKNSVVQSNKDHAMRPKEFQKMIRAVLVPEAWCV